MIPRKARKFRKTFRRLSADAHPRALMFFSCHGANRYAVLFRIQTVKKAETRKRKIQEFIQMLEEEGENSRATKGESSKAIELHRENENGGDQDYRSGAGRIRSRVAMCPAGNGSRTLSRCGRCDPLPRTRRRTSPNWSAQIRLSPILRTPLPGSLKKRCGARDRDCLRSPASAPFPPGTRLAVDRVTFAARVTEAISREPLITVHREEVTHVEEN